MLLFCKKSQLKALSTFSVIILCDVMIFVHIFIETLHLHVKIKFIAFKSKGFFSNTFAYTFSDPRSPDAQPQRQWNQQPSTPNQSKSFKVLQKITDTERDHEVDNSNEVAELQQPHYARPLGLADMNEKQLRKLMLNENDRNFLKQVKNDSKINVKYYNNHIAL